MILVKRGSTRMAIILFKVVVFKIPYFWGGFCSRHKYGNLKEVQRLEGFKGVWKKSLIGKLLKGLRIDFLMGIGANISEGWLWLNVQSGFLQPTLCLILCNIQHYAGDDIPTYEQLRPFFDSLPEKGKLTLSCIDPHQFEMANWRIVDRHLRLIDYGAKVYDANFTLLLFRWHKEIESELSKPIT